VTESVTAGVVSAVEATDSEVGVVATVEDGTGVLEAGTIVGREVGVE
jgi:hypothetical protein